MKRYTSYIYIEDIAKHEGKDVTLKGWLYNKTGKGKIQFLILRDGTGIIQCVLFKPNMSEEMFDAAKSLTQESSFEVTGTVKASEIAPGWFEIDVKDFNVIHISSEYPITPKEHGDSFLIENRHLWLRSSHSDFLEP